MRPPLAAIALAAFLAHLPAQFAWGQEPAEPPQPVFEFHSGFWVNLHHFLYQQARISKSLPDLAGGGAPAQPSAPISTAGLSKDEQREWSAGVAYYTEHFADRDLLFNGDMVILKNRLEEMETCPDISGRASRDCASGLRPELVSALERAAPVYRAHWWAEQDRAGRAWIAQVVPMVRQKGRELARQLADAYQADWPKKALRVDVVSYAGPLGAYTTLDPVRITISSSDPRNQAMNAFEVIFHEGSHALAEWVRDAISRECRQRGKPIPRELWHALVFYTTGEMVRRALGHSEQSPDYVPYAVHYGLYRRGWENYERLLDRFWKPYLDGQATFDTAIARLVSAL